MNRTNNHHHWSLTDEEHVAMAAMLLMAFLDTTAIAKETIYVTHKLSYYLPNRDAISCHAN